jgi:DNA-binding transcriptional LysR family regulator
LLEEPFLAPPASAGPLRDYWLATEERGERPIRIAAEVSTPDEAFEAVAGGVGVVLLSGGNAAIYKAGGRRLQTGRGPEPKPTRSRLANTRRTRGRSRLRRRLPASRDGAALRIRLHARYG